MPGYRSALYFAVLVGVDTFSYVVSLTLAFFTRTSLSLILPLPRLNTSFEDFAALVWIPALVFFFNFILGLYYRRDPFWIESGRLIKALFYTYVVVFAVISLGRFNEISRLTIILLMLFSLILFPLFRLLLKRRLWGWGFLQLSALIAGDESLTPKVIKAFEAEKVLGINIRYVLEDSSVSKLEKILKNDVIDAAILVPGAGEREEADFFRYIHTKVRRLYYIPAGITLDLTNAETGQLLRHLQGYMLLNNSLESSFNRCAKRFFDLLFAILTTPLALPLIGVLALAVRLTSKGPAIFSHERVGRNGELFKVYKLRTMYYDSAERLERLLAEDEERRREWESSFKLKDDPRVTRLGRLLRKSSLDELPQFFNVFQGTMSFVGPRPVLKEELDKYYGANAIYYKMVSPGITGLWQVSGRSDTSYDDRVEMDSWYAYNWSAWLDFVILFSTPLVVALRKGAY